MSLDVCEWCSKELNTSTGPGPICAYCIEDMHRALIVPGVSVTVPHPIAGRERGRVIELTSDGDRVILNVGGYRRDVPIDRVVALIPS